MRHQLARRFPTLIMIAILLAASNAGFAQLVLGAGFEFTNGLAWGKPHYGYVCIGNVVEGEETFFKEASETLVIHGIPGDTVSVTILNEEGLVQFADKNMPNPYITDLTGPTLTIQLSSKVKGKEFDHTKTLKVRWLHTDTSSGEIVVTEETQYAGGLVAFMLKGYNERRATTFPGVALATAPPDGANDIEECRLIYMTAVYSDPQWDSMIGQPVPLSLKLNGWFEYTWRCTFHSPSMLDRALFKYEFAVRGDDFGEMVGRHDEHTEGAHGRNPYSRSRNMKEVRFRRDAEAYFELQPETWGLREVLFLTEFSVTVWGNVEAQLTASEEGDQHSVKLVVDPASPF